MPRSPMAPMPFPLPWLFLLVDLQFVKHLEQGVGVEQSRAAEGSLLTPAPVSLLFLGRLSFPRDSAPAGGTPINMCKHWWVQPGAPPVLDRTKALESSVFSFLLQKGNVETDRSNYPFHLNYQEWNFFF